jgi:hypothetical protein
VLTLHGRRSRPVAQEMVSQTHPALERCFPELNRQLKRGILNLGRRGIGGAGLDLFFHDHLGNLNPEMSRESHMVEEMDMRLNVYY